MTYKRNDRRDFQESDVLKGLAAGLIAGLAATWVMTQFQNTLSKLSEDDENPRNLKSSLEEKQKNRQQNKKAVEPESPQKGEDKDDATVKTARAISENVFDHQLTKDEKKVAGTVVHYSFGTLMGGLYGVANELAPVVNAGGGLAFGTLIWFGADEVAIPSLGLAKPPTETPISTHAYALVSHFVYGLTTEAIRKAVRAAM